jgi:GST-like protein
MTSVSSDAKLDSRLDEALALTFPASDPISLAISTRAADNGRAMNATRSKPYTLYCASGGGSMIVEVAFGFTDLPVEIVDVPWEETGWNSKTLKALNPLGQVPTLLMPDGAVMTESAAMILHLADVVPDFALVPPPSHAQRAQFLRWLVFLVSAVYPTFTYGDVTERWVGASAKEGAGKALREGTDDHRKTLWRFVETQVSGPWFLGDTFSALDVYMWPMTYWRPGLDWFKAECPKLHNIALAMNAHPVCKKVAARNNL